MTGIEIKRNITQLKSSLVYFDIAPHWSVYHYLFWRKLELQKSLGNKYKKLYFGGNDKNCHSSSNKKPNCILSQGGVQFHHQTKLEKLDIERQFPWCSKDTFYTISHEYLFLLINSKVEKYLAVEFFLKFILFLFPTSLIFWTFFKHQTNIKTTFLRISLWQSENISCYLILPFQP